MGSDSGGAAGDPGGAGGGGGGTQYLKSEVFCGAERRSSDTYSPCQTHAHMHMQNNDRKHLRNSFTRGRTMLHAHTGNDGQIGSYRLARDERSRRWAWCRCIQAGHMLTPAMLVGSTIAHIQIVKKANKPRPAPVPTITSMRHQFHRRFQRFRCATCCRPAFAIAWVQLCCTCANKLTAAGA